MDGYLNSLIVATISISFRRKVSLWCACPTTRQSAKLRLSSSKTSRLRFWENSDLMKLRPPMPTDWTSQTLSDRRWLSTTEAPGFPRPRRSSLIWTKSRTIWFKIYVSWANPRLDVGTRLQAERGAGEGRWATCDIPSLQETRKHLSKDRRSNTKRCRGIRKSALQSRLSFS